MGNENTDAGELLLTGFTRQEVIALTSCDANGLAYLEKTGVVNPSRFGSKKKPTVIYSWEQMIAVQLVGELRGTMPASAIKTFALDLAQQDVDNWFQSNCAIIAGDQVLWVELSSSSHVSKTNAGKVFLAIAAKNRSKITKHSFWVVPALSQVVAQLWAAAKESPAIDFLSFQKRAKVKSFAIITSLPVPVR
jgi:hypothetical protein